MTDSAHATPSHQQDIRPSSDLLSPESPPLSPHADIFSASPAPEFPAEDSASSGPIVVQAVADAPSVSNAPLLKRKHNAITSPLDVDQGASKQKFNPFKQLHQRQTRDIEDLYTPLNDQGDTTSLTKRGLAPGSPEQQRVRKRQKPEVSVGSDDAGSSQTPTSSKPEGTSKAERLLAKTTKRPAQSPFGLGVAVKSRGVGGYRGGRSRT